MTFWLYMFLSFAYCFCSFSICGRMRSMIRDCFLVLNFENTSSGMTIVFKTTVNMITPTAVIPTPSTSQRIISPIQFKIMGSSCFTMKSIKFSDTPEIAANKFIIIILGGVQSTHLTLKKFSYAGSYPPLVKGLQRKILHAPRIIPRITPLLLIERRVYSEQVGVNMHVPCERWRW